MELVRLLEREREKVATVDTHTPDSVGTCVC